jgi:hypothetical protein
LGECLDSIKQPWRRIRFQDYFLTPEQQLVGLFGKFSPIPISGIADGDGPGSYREPDDTRATFSGIALR